jgi:hypothetical protein
MKPMRSAIAIRKEHKAVRSKMDELMRDGDAAGHQGPLPKDEELYFRLYSIKQTLEWVYPSLIKTTAKGVERQMELAGYRHYVAGPLHATLYP